MRIHPGIVVLCAIGALGGAAIFAGPDTRVRGAIDGVDGVSFALTGDRTPGRETSYMEQLPVDTLRGQRLRVSVELAEGEAARVVAVVKGTGDPLITRELLIPGRATPGWTRHELALPVPDEGKTLMVVASFTGAGTLRARHLRVSSLGPIDGTAPLAPEARRELDSAFAIVRRHALRRDSVDWERAEPEIRRLAAGARRASDVEPAISFMLAMLGDHHSYLWSKEQASRYQEGTAPLPAPAVRAVGNDIGYVVVPAHDSRSRRTAVAYAQALHDGMRRVAHQARCGWIVDLRTNTGGNKSPMVAGLQPMLGRTVVGMFLTPVADERLAQAPYTAVELVEDVGLTAPSDLASLADSPVAVLTGPMTASSGEAVAIAFRGRARTRFFGSPTSGKSSGITGYTLPSGTTIGLATSVMADRMGRAHWGPVAPDENVADSAGRDATRDAAVRWLRQQPECTR